MTCLTHPADCAREHDFAGQHSRFVFCAAVSFSIRQYCSSGRPGCSVPVVYALLIRIMGIGGETPTFIGGVSLVAVTVALFALALHSMYTDIRAEEASSRHESPETELTELNFEESQNCQGLKDDSSEAGRGGAPRPEPPPPHSFQAEDDQQSCMGTFVLCSAEPQQRTTAM